MTRRYLLVDDNRAFAENLAEILEGSGAEAVVAGSAGEALRRLDGGVWDALVTDLAMPGRSGAELVHEARRRDPGLPVVLLSAFARDAQVRAARRFGLLAVRSKPADVAELVALLGRAQRGAMVLVLEGDGAAAECLCEALGARGLTPCTVHSAGDIDALPAAPFAAVVDGAPGDGAPLARLRARFPQVPVLTPGGGDDEASRAVAERLERLFAPERP